MKRTWVYHGARSRLLAKHAQWPTRSRSRSSTICPAIPTRLTRKSRRFLEGRRRDQVKLAEAEVKKQTFSSDLDTYEITDKATLQGYVREPRYDCHHRRRLAALSRTRQQAHRALKTRKPPRHTTAMVGRAIAKRAGEGPGELRRESRIKSFARCSPTCRTKSSKPT
jgi:hypothetical protein